jgi:hypothetical protein
MSVLEIKRSESVAPESKTPVAVKFTARVAHLFKSLTGRGPARVNKFVIQDHALREELRAIALHQSMVQESAPGNSRRTHRAFL